MVETEDRVSRFTSGKGKLFQAVLVICAILYITWNMATQ